MQLVGKHAQHIMQVDNTNPIANEPTCNLHKKRNAKTGAQDPAGS